VIQGKQWIGRERCTGYKADEVEHIGHGGGLIEIVDAPDKPPLAVTPRPIVFGMNIPDRQDVRRIEQLGAPFADLASPPIVGRPQEQKLIFAHTPMLLLYGILVNLALRTQPVVKA